MRAGYGVEITYYVIIYSEKKGQVDTFRVDCIVATPKILVKRKRISTERFQYR